MAHPSFPSIALLLLGLCAALPAPPARAEAPRRPSAAQLEDIRRWLCPHGGSPVKGVPGRCDRGMDRTPWDNGLAPAARNAVMACPEGTRPVLARGHRDIIRCLPS
ncbi:hypothetical protein NON00_10030 [Roseomonas sp. GC11]|uniref:hypothetical protein n=1 Tax=Roseomonas sp. GC11 TaxID=2950546 RepID=UPI002109705F|nr:hypothetical protein [Roseomonas sp. GC11]MCQ4160265.1 hypothetical protein [Roseomonas sp. GC11]